VSKSYKDQFKEESVRRRQRQQKQIAAVIILIGVLVSIIGTIIPPFLVISVISVCYQAFRDNFFVSQMLEGMQAE
jgi:chromate transport protein ChrA